MVRCSVPSSHRRNRAVVWIPRRAECERDLQNFDTLTTVLFGPDISGGDPKFALLGGPRFSVYADSPFRLVDELAIERGAVKRNKYRKWREIPTLSQH
jgi:hypothetical protein